MTKEEAKEVFLNRGFVNGFFDGDKWRESIVVISKWLEQDPCEDCISRQAVLEIFGYVMDYWREHAIDVEPHEIKDALIEQYEFTAKELSKLPPVTPKPKIGHWIVNEWGNISCSECGCTALYDKVYPGESVFGQAIRVKSTFCPTCGIRMQAESEG